MIDGSMKRVVEPGRFELHGRHQLGSAGGDAAAGRRKVSRFRVSEGSYEPERRERGKREQHVLDEPLRDPEGVAATTAAAISGNLRLINGQLLLPRATIAITRFDRFC